MIFIRDIRLASNPIHPKVVENSHDSAEGGSDLTHSIICFAGFHSFDMSLRPPKHAASESSLKFQIVSDFNCLGHLLPSAQFQTNVEGQAPPASPHSKSDQCGTPEQQDYKITI